LHNFFGLFYIIIRYIVINYVPFSILGYTIIMRILYIYINIYLFIWAFMWAQVYSTAYIIFKYIIIYDYTKWVCHDHRLHYKYNLKILIKYYN